MWTNGRRSTNHRIARCRGRQERERSGSDHKAESDEELDFMSAKESKGENRGANCRGEPKTAEQGGDNAKKGEKANRKTWSDVVKGLKTEDELETANSVES